MKFVVSSTALSSKLSMLSKVINSKNSLAILEDYIFDIVGDTLTLRASDGENTMETTITLSSSSDDGRIALKNNDLLEAVKGFSEQPLTFICDMEKHTCKVEYQNGFLILPIDALDEVPVTPTLSTSARTITINSALLLENITRSLFATAQENLRPVMNGIFFDLKSDGLSVVASDGRKLVKNTITTISSDEPTSFILSKKPATLLKGVLAKDDSDVTISYDNNNAFIVYSDGNLTCRLIEGRYPNYAAVIPQNNTNEATIDRQALLTALRRVTPFANGTSHLVKFHIDSNILRLDAEDLDFSKTASENILCQYNGVPMNIGFNGEAFVDVLGVLECADVTIQLADPSRAGLVLPGEQPAGQDVVMLLMPMLVND